MSELKTLARPYAMAAYRFASEHKKIKEWGLMLSSLHSLVLTEAVQSLLNRPNIGSEGWLKILRPAITSCLDNHGLNFLKLVLLHRRLALIPLIADLFQVIQAEAQNSVTVDLTTAIELTTDDQKTLVEAVTHRLGQSVQPHFCVDERLIGGVVIRVGDRYVLDGSLSSQLARLKTTFQS